jgi:hypothetical protein
MNSEIHAVEFKKKYYNLNDAKKWMKDHDKKIGIIHQKLNTLWFNQTPKRRYKFFIKKKIKKGINLVIGYLK